MHHEVFHFSRGRRAATGGWERSKKRDIAENSPVAFINPPAGNISQTKYNDSAKDAFAASPEPTLHSHLFVRDMDNRETRINSKRTF